MSPHFSVALTALSIAVFASGCSSSSTHECTFRGFGLIEVPTNQTCPSAEEATHALQRVSSDARDTKVELGKPFDQEPQTICWYRKITNPSYACVTEARQRKYVVLERMGAWNAPAIEKYGEFCDGDQNVLSYPVPAQSGGPAECPSSQDLQVDFGSRADGTALGGLVARDFLPARIACTYGTTSTSTCTKSSHRIPGLSPE